MQVGSENVLDKLFEAADYFYTMGCVKRPHLLFQRCAVFLQAQLEMIARVKGGQHLCKLDQEKD